MNSNSIQYYLKLVAAVILFAAIAVSPSHAFNSKANTTKRASSPSIFMFNSDKDDSPPNGAPVQEPIQVKTRNPLRLLVLRLGLTEPRAISPFNYGKYDGTFNCAYCGHELFDSSAKYDSGSGWPSFWRSSNDESIGYKMEWDNRLECRCKNCNSHLGHVFLDGPRPETVSKQLLDASPSSDPRGRTATYLPRFCINGASMTFSSRDDDLAKDESS